MSTTGIQISMPEKFDGTRSKFRGFLQQVKLYLRLHPFQYPDGFTQVGFIGALLSGSALSWFAPLMEKDSRILYDLNAFLEAFTATFGESDRERVAETKLVSLRQGSRSATTYAAEFQNLACDVDWNDKALINQFRYGLRDNVKDLLLTMPKAESLEQFIAQAIACDNRLFERRQEQRLGWRGTSQVMTATPKFSETSSSRPEPMQIDTVRFKPLTEQEKTRRRQEGLCLYCGEARHTAQHCPRKQRNYKMRSTITKEDSMSENEFLQSQ